MRHAPSFLVQHPQLHFDRADLALYWSHAQGLDLRAMHERYVAGETLDLRHVRARVRAIAEDLSAAARRSDRPHLAALFLRDPRAIHESDTATPTLAAFALQIDPSGDFYSQAELQALWQAEHGAAPQNQSLLRAQQRRLRLLRRLREALSWVESQGVSTPEPEHRIDAWLAAVYATRLAAAGLDTLAQLIERINTRGLRWQAGIRGLGVTKAGLILQWLQRQASLAQHLQTSARMTRLQLAQLALNQVGSSAVVPLERLHMPQLLNGFNGRFRGPQAACTLGADNDLDAVKAWLRSKTSAHTRRSYQREAERLLLWCVVEAKKPLSSLTVEDCERFREFVRAPLPAAQWCGPRGTPRWSRAWRPFEAGLSPAAERHALIVLKSLGAWLRAQNYLVANPWAALNVAAGGRPAIDKRRSFTPSQWALIADALHRLDDRGARPRLRFAMWLLYSTGMRLSEVVTRQVADVSQTCWSDGQMGWTLRVLGKGGRLRQTPIAGAVFEELKRYFATRGWADMADAPSAAYLLARATGEGARLPHGLTYDPFGGIQPGTLYRQVKAFLKRVAKRCEADEPLAAMRLRQASTHWLRHTFATTVANMTGDVVLTRDLLGHASIATTSIYTDSDDIKQRDAVERLMAAT